MELDCGLDGRAAVRRNCGGPTDPERSRRNELIRRNLPLARRLACRFTRRGVPRDDLIQVASVGLIMAVDRFDANRGVPFEAFATPTILGEIKRHFRDAVWDLRVPRGAKERHLAVNAALERLSQELGHAPTISELATAVGYAEEEVLESMEAGAAFNARSLFCESGSLGAVELERAVAQDDLWTSDCVDRLLVAEALETLPRREELILRLRYWDRLSQDQIARRLGISQMHVSRLARRGVARLSRRLADTP